MGCVEVRKTKYININLFTADNSGITNMRIAMIHTPFWARAGGERQILRLAIGLEKLGHEVEIFTNAVNEESYPEFFEKVKINVIPHPLAGKLPSGITPQVAKPKISETTHGDEAKVPGIRKWMSTIVSTLVQFPSQQAGLQLMPPFSTTQKSLVLPSWKEKD